jgi:hypothetical protein
MAYINYARINAQRNTGKSSAVTSITKDFNSIPWTKAWETYKEAGDEWEETALAAHKSHEDDAYEHLIRKKELALEEINSESGAYEANLSDEFPKPPYSPLPGRAYGRRKAGQKALVEKFIKEHNFGDWSESIMPQIITKLGNMVTTKNDNGLISGNRFIADNFKTDADKGLWAFLMLDTRGSYLTTQYKGTARAYSSLVPLILYAIRLVKGVPYTAWDPEEIRSVVNHELAEAMLFRTEDWPTKDEILEGREKGLTVGSGKDVGKVRTPVSAPKLYATSGTCFNGMPNLAQVMLSQIWVAHPDNRTKYMVLDPLNWDRVPPALIQLEIFNPKPQQLAEYTSDTPWDL